MENLFGFIFMLILFMPIISLPIVIIYGMIQEQKKGKIEKLELKKEILDREIMSHKTKTKLLEEENKKLDKIIYAKLGDSELNNDVDDNLN